MLSPSMVNRGPEPEKERKDALSVRRATHESYALEVLANVISPAIVTVAPALGYCKQVSDACPTPIKYKILLRASGYL